METPIRCGIPADDFTGWHEGLQRAHRDAHEAADLAYQLANMGRWFGFGTLESRVLGAINCRMFSPAESKSRITGISAVVHALERSARYRDYRLNADANAALISAAKGDPYRAGWSTGHSAPHAAVELLRWLMSLVFARCMDGDRVSEAKLIEHLPTIQSRIVEHEYEFDRDSLAALTVAIDHHCLEAAKIIGNATDENGQNGQNRLSEKKLVTPSGHALDGESETAWAEYKDELKNEPKLTIPRFVEEYYGRDDVTPAIEPETMIRKLREHRKLENGQKGQS